MYSRNRRKGESVADCHARRIREADSRIPEPILAMLSHANAPGHPGTRQEPCPDCAGTGQSDAYPGEPCALCLGMGSLDIGRSGHAAAAP